MISVIILSLQMKGYKEEPPDLVEEGGNAEEICFQFVNQYLSNKEGGIYTNYIPQNETFELASGHEVLSESQGLFLLYLVERNDKERFDKNLKYIKENLLTSENLLLWRINEEEENISSGNASLDDLRIMKALQKASAKWGDKQYKKLYRELEEALYQFNVKDNQLYGYYDIQYKNNMSTIPLCYFDLESIWQLQNIRKDWKMVYDNSLTLIKNSYLGEAFPFYAFEYDYSTGRYSENTTIRMTESILTVLHLAQINEHKEETIEWLLNELHKGGIYGEYNTITGKPANRVESTAIYATIAQIGKVINHEELYKLAMEKMLVWQIIDKDSHLYGAFGDAKKEEVYSYDNLQALLAFK